MGGKFGANVEEEWNQTNVSDLWNVSLDKMRERFGSDGQWLYQLVRGIDSVSYTHLTLPTNREV